MLLKYRWFTTFLLDLSGGEDHGPYWPMQNGNNTGFLECVRCASRER